MDIKEFSKIMQYLFTAYNKELNNDLLAIWYDFFKRTDIGLFKNAVIQAINQCKYFPSIAEIRELITLQNSPCANLKADEEWEKVIESIRKYGSYREDEALASLTPITRNIVSRLGFFDICVADETRKYNLRSAFIKSFESEKQDLIKYESAIINDTEDMLAIQERNRESLNKLASGLIKRIEE